MKRSSLLSMVMVLCLMFIALPAPTAGSGAEEATWQYGPPSPFQYQRFDAAFVPGPAGEPWANRVYFMGGRISAPSELPDIWAFDPVTGAYADTGANMIEDVSNYNSNVVLNDGTGRGPAVYVVGGTNKDGGGANTGLVQRYYPQINQVESLPEADYWSGMVNGYRVGGMGSAVVDDIIYVFGGWETSVSPYFYGGTWALDPKQPSGSRWTDLGVTLAVPRSYVMTAVQNGKIYAIGGTSGYVGGDLVPTDSVEVLNTANLAAGWTALGSLPLAIAEGRAFGFDDDTRSGKAPWDGFLFTAGGGDWPDISREAMSYDIGAGTWDQGFPDLNDRRVNNAGTFIPLCTPNPDDGLPGLWVFGGRSENGCDPPYGATEFYPLPSYGTGLTGATIDGPAELMAGEMEVYSAILEPVSATLPIEVTWSNGATGASATYGWAEPGLYTIAVTATNCPSATVTATLTVEVLCVELAGATVAGPIELLVDEAGTYSVTLGPPTATLPIEVAWSNGVTDTKAVYSWTIPGDYTVVVTATNCGGMTMVTDTLGVTVAPQMHYVYLPVVLKNE
ncbi:MAG: hypothetical protein JXM73_15800 [Anaerolineae bacterium]|nr:hypothetical protein [Anaerolineae bacterium]